MADDATQGAWNPVAGTQTSGTQWDSGQTQSSGVFGGWEDTTDVVQSPQEQVAPVVEAPVQAQTDDSSLDFSLWNESESATSDSPVVEAGAAEFNPEDLNLEQDTPVPVAAEIESKNEEVVPTAEEVAAPVFGWEESQEATESPEDIQIDLPVESEEVSTEPAIQTEWQEVGEPAIFGWDETETETETDVETDVESVAEVEEAPVSDVEFDSVWSEDIPVDHIPAVDEVPLNVEETTAAEQEPVIFEEEADTANAEVETKTEDSEEEAVNVEASSLWEEDSAWSDANDDAIEDKFDDMYDTIEELYSLDDLEVGSQIEVLWTDNQNFKVVYHYSIPDSAKDAVKVIRTQTDLATQEEITSEIEFSLDSGGIEVFLDENLLFNHNMFEKHPKRRSEVLDKLSKLDFVLQEYKRKLAEKKELEEKDNKKREEMLGFFRDF